MNNGAGVAGIAPSARILPLKVLDCTGHGSLSDLSAAITFAAEHGARVINMSLYATTQMSCPIYLQDAVDWAVGTRGVVVAAAAGNSGDASVSYPAGCAGVLSVVPRTTLTR